MSEKILVNEIFPAIQGEGMSIGKPVLFVRFYGCNLKCEWCDSSYAIEGGEHKDYTLDELMKNIRDNCMGLNRIVFTGGEPMIYLNKYDIINRLPKDTLFFNIEIETNGLLLDAGKITDWYEQKFPIQYNISPKFFKGWQEKYLTKPMYAIFATVERFSQLKFVMENKTEQLRKDCIANIKEFIDYHMVDKQNVYIMTEGVTREEQLANMATDIDFCLKEGYNYTPRMHILAFDKKRKC